MNHAAVPPAAGKPRASRPIIEVDAGSGKTGPWKLNTMSAR